MKKHNSKFSPPLDAGIKKAVMILSQNGVETFESCEGGKGHSYPEPTVRFHGDYCEGLRALGIAIRANLKVFTLRRTYQILNGEITSPCWELTFIPSKAS